MALIVTELDDFGSIADATTLTFKIYALNQCIAIDDEDFMYRHAFISSRDMYGRLQMTHLYLKPGKKHNLIPVSGGSYDKAVYYAFVVKYDGKWHIKRVN
jgi:hypothetical protein